MAFEGRPSTRDRPVRSHIALGLLAALVACSGSGIETTTTQPTAATWYSVIERAEATVACMREEGVDAELSEPFGVLYPDLPGMENVYNQCSEKIDRTMPFPPPMSAEESYDAWREAADCLRELGFDIPPAPSIEVWREESNENWDPYDNIPIESFWDIHKKCPQPGLGLEPSTPP